MSACKMDDSPWCAPGACAPCDKARQVPWHTCINGGPSVPCSACSLGNTVRYAQPFVAAPDHQPLIDQLKQAREDILCYEVTTQLVKSEYDIQKAIEMIVALTRNLLSLPDDVEVGTHVMPKNNEFVVTVEVAGFIILQEKRRRMSDAIEATLAVLSSRVHQRITEAQRLLDTSASR